MQVLRLQFNTRGVRGMLNSDGVQRDLKRRADRIAAAAGDGMAASVQSGRTRARGSLYSRTPEAMEREARHAALTRSEEHTSELQSRENLVCRLLLEKKKKFVCHIQDCLIL